MRKINEDDITKGEYIDLGLPSGLLWASCNLGAEKPCDYGKYFQWGDTVGYEGDKVKAHSTWETAPFNIENCNMLKPEYDAVSVSTCGEAHIPTMTDFDELLDNTTNEWCQCVVLGDDHKEHKVYGRLFTSKVNGNNIFIPTAGFAWSGSIFNNFANLWSSSLYMSDNGYAWHLYFDSDIFLITNNDRAFGFSVRGVKPSN